MLAPRNLTEEQYTPHLLVNLFCQIFLVVNSTFSLLVSKKKTPKTVEIEDLFSEDAEPDLLSSSDTTATDTTAPKPASKTPKAPPVPSKHLDPATRQTRFEELYQSVLPHLNPSVIERRKLPPMKYVVWTHLVDLAQNEEELKRVVELVPSWKDANRRQKNKGGLEERWGESVVSESSFIHHRLCSEN